MCFDAFLDTLIELARIVIAGNRRNSSPHVTWNWVMSVTPAIGCLDLRCFPGVTVRSG